MKGIGSNNEKLKKCQYGNFRSRLLKSEGHFIQNFNDTNSRDFYAAVWLSFAEQQLKKKFSETDVDVFKMSFDDAFNHFILTLVLGENSHIAEAKPSAATTTA